MVTDSIDEFFSRPGFPVEIEGLPDNAIPGGHKVEFVRIQGGKAIFRYLGPDVPEPEPDFRYLLVKVGPEIGYQALERVPGVLEVTPHPGDCCCKNCPWQGSHYGPVGQRTHRED